MKLVLGHWIAFDDNNDLIDHPGGALAIDQGVIVARGSADELRRAYPHASIDDHGEQWLMPGFVDAHVHYPQLPIIASHGEALLEWLERYTFPEESKYHNLDYAHAQAQTYLDQSLSYGTTSSVVFATSHATSAEALFEQAQARGVRLATGKVLMDRNCPDSLRDTAITGFQDSERLIRQWHGVDRLEYAITPRFAPTSTPDQLAACGALWDAYPGVLMQTHLSENEGELRWVAELFPGSADYLGVYEQFDLIRPRALLGHSIHLSGREAASVKERGAALVHCPTSNLFLGSGLFECVAHQQADQKIALASDVGGGSSLSMFATMTAAYQVSALLGRVLSVQDLLYHATLGAARAVGWSATGNLAVGFEADVLVVDPKATAMSEQRVSRAQDLHEALFSLIVLADDRHIRRVYLAGS